MDLWGEEGKKKKTLFKKSVIEGRRNREKKEKRGRYREISVGREKAIGGDIGGDSEGVRREKKIKGREVMKDFIVRKAEWAKENIVSWVRRR